MYDSEYDRKYTSEYNSKYGKYNSKYSSKYGSGTIHILTIRYFNLSSLSVVGNESGGEPLCGGTYALRVSVRSTASGLEVDGVRRIVSIIIGLL